MYLFPQLHKITFSIFVSSDELPYIDNRNSSKLLQLYLLRSDYAVLQTRQGLNTMQVLLQQAEPVQASQIV